MKEYKVLSQNDKWLTGKFDPDNLEAGLNHFAKEGWRVVSCVTAKVPGVMSPTSREEIIVILERDAVESKTNSSVAPAVAWNPGS